MRCKLRLGYPYANSNPHAIKDAVVILEQSEYEGFSVVYRHAKPHRLLRGDQGPKILSGIKNIKGLKGTLHEFEPDDKRRSIAQNGEIIGSGKSMQLALALAVHAVYGERNNDAPLVLFSAAIERAAGTASFIDAAITPCCSAGKVENCLLRKITAAQKAGAAAFVVPRRDAETMRAEMGIATFGIERLAEIGRAKADTSVIGVAEDQLPDLAEMLGISRYHYTREGKTEPTNPVSYFLSAILIILLVNNSWFLLLVRYNFSEIAFLTNSSLNNFLYLPLFFSIVVFALVTVEHRMWVMYGYLNSKILRQRWVIPTVIMGLSVPIGLGQVTSSSPGIDKLKPEYAKESIWTSEQIIKQKDKNSVREKINNCYSSIQKAIDAGVVVNYDDELTQLKLMKDTGKDVLDDEELDRAIYFVHRALTPAWNHSITDIPMMISRVLRYAAIGFVALHLMYFILVLLFIRSTSIFYRIDRSEFRKLGQILLYAIAILSLWPAFRLYTVYHLSCVYGGIDRMYFLGYALVLLFVCTSWLLCLGIGKEPHVFYCFVLMGLGLAAFIGQFSENCREFIGRLMPDLNIFWPHLFICFVIYGFMFVIPSYLILRAPNFTLSHNTGRTCCHLIREDPL